MLNESLRIPVAHDQWPIKAIMFTDCFSLFENVRSSNPSIQERSLLREMASFKESVEQGCINEWRWCCTKLQYADSLTKLMDDSLLRSCITSARIRVRPTVQERTSVTGVLREFRYQGPTDIKISDPDRQPLKMLDSKLSSLTDVEIGCYLTELYDRGSIVVENAVFDASNMNIFIAQLSEIENVLKSLPCVEDCLEN